MSLSIVTPWRDHPELCTDYARAVRGADVFVIDTGSTPANTEKLDSMCERLNGVYVPYPSGKPFSFAASCNLGIDLAVDLVNAIAAEAGEKDDKDIILMLNNDVIAVPGWLDAVRRDVKPGALYGVATDIRVVEGQPILYLEGWCIAATIETWHELGGWDAETFQRPYWEDVDLSWRATQLGIRLLRRPWMVTHLGNRTSATTPGAYDASDANRRAFERKVRAARMVAA